MSLPWKKRDDEPSFPWKKRDDELRERALARIADLHARIREAKTSLHKNRLGDRVKELTRSRHRDPGTVHALAHAANKELKKAKKCLNRGSGWNWGVDKRLAQADTHIDTASALVLRIAPCHEVAGWMPSVMQLMKAYLPADDERKRKLETIALTVCQNPKQAKVSPKERSVIADAAVAAYRVLEERRHRTSNFVGNLWAWTIGLAVAAVLIVVSGIAAPHWAPLCFTPEDRQPNVVCPTDATSGDEGNFQQATSRWDYMIVEALGALGAAVTAVAAFRRLDGSPTPYHVPSALAVLKLPLGALAAVLGLQFIKGNIFPGLSDLDSSAQILAWAVIFGAAQQLFTHFVDQEGRALLASISGPHTMLAVHPGRHDDLGEQG
jgi:hypothetical protein